MLNDNHDNNIKMMYREYQKALQRKREEEYPEPTDESLIASYEALQKALKQKAEREFKKDIEDSRKFYLEKEKKL